MISFTIDSPEDWSLLTSLIDKEYSWRIEVTHSLINFVTQLQQRLPSSNESSGEHIEILDSNRESVHVSHIPDGSVVTISHSKTVYLMLILKDSNRDVMVCDYPRYTVNITHPSSKVMTCVACVIAASITTFIVGRIINDLFKSKA